MHIKQLSKNKYICTADGPRDPVTGKRKQVQRRGKSRKEAKERVEQAIADLKKNISIDTNIRFYEFAEKWFENYKLRGNKPNTLDYREYCISLMNQYIRNMKVREVSALNYQNILNDLHKKSTSFYTIRGVHNVAKMIFKYAKELGLIEANPIDAAFLPKEQRTVEEIEGDNIKNLYLESHELKEFLSYLDKYPNIVAKTILYTIAFTGMRPGECVSLKNQDVDFQLKQIKITKTTYAGKKSRKGDFQLTPPKTFGSVRIVDVDDIVLNQIKEMQTLRKKLKWPKSDYLFSTNDGHPPTVKYLRQTTYRIGLKTTISKSLYTYMLRHTHISLLAEAGVDLNYIMDRVGHKDSKTTTAIYLHVTQGMRDAARAKMHMRFNELLDGDDEKKNVSKM